MELYEKNGNALYILEILKKYSDENHPLQVSDIARIVEKTYGMIIDPRTIRRNINLLKYKLDYDISTRADNGHGYFLYKDPDTDFEPGEIRAIIDTFSYANYIAPSIAKSVIKKCKNLQNVYENEKLEHYKIYSKDTKTDNKEVLKNIEDIEDAIFHKEKITFEYWKFDLTPKLEKVILSKPQVSPYAVIYDLQQFYLVCLKDGHDKLYTYRLDRMKNVQRLEGLAACKVNEEKLEEFITSQIGMFGGPKTEVEFTCRLELLENVLEQFGKDTPIAKCDDEHFKATVQANKEGLKYWILRNVESVDILKPAELRAEIKDILKTALERY